MIDNLCKITIGIPVYNVEKYIANCVSSVLSQDFDEIFEIIVIDDHSPDKSIKIIKQIQASHSRGYYVRILRQPQNMGCWAARNRVIQEARGKYIYFLDADDYITPNTLKTLYRYAEQYEAEAVYGSVVSIDEQGIPVPFSQGDMKLPLKILVGKDALASYANMNTHPTLYNFIWNVLLRKDFIYNNKLVFHETRFGDDILFQTDMQPLIERAVLVPEVTYYYVIRGGSLSNFQERQQIELSEILQYIEIYSYIKNQVHELKDKAYFETRCVKVMKYMLYIICGALKNRNKIHPALTNRIIRDAMKHPIGISEIIRFKNHKFLNLGFWIVGTLPPRLSVLSIKAIGKWKHLL